MTTNVTFDSRLFPEHTFNRKTISHLLTAIALVAILFEAWHCLEKWNHADFIGVLAIFGSWLRELSHALLDDLLIDEVRH